MIDIAFNNSAAGVVQFSRYNGALQTEGVLPLLFTLSYGALSGDLCEAEAKKETIAFRNFIPDLDEKEYIKAYKKDVDERRKALRKLDRYLKQGKDIRLWVSATADDRCGLYWLCDRMKNTKSRIYVVPCPGYEWDAEKKKLIHSPYWASVEDWSALGAYAQKARELSLEELELHASLWQETQTENAELRILLNDRVIGVGKDFFDNELLPMITETPKPQGWIVGSFLYKWRGLSMGFADERIEHLLEVGLIQVDTDLRDDYGAINRRLLKRTSEKK